MTKVFTTTDRLILREWGEEDGDRFFAVMNTPKVMRHLGGVQTREEFEAPFQRLRAFQRDFGHTFWLLEDKASGELLGFCGLKRVNAPGAGDLTGNFEIGWRLRESAWGKGIAKEAAIASLNAAFDRFGADSVVALTIAANAPSQGLMERLGMQRRSDFDFDDDRFGPEMNPTLVWRIEAAEWPAARAAALNPIVRRPG